MTRMKHIFVAAACALPLTLPGMLSAQGAKGMSGSGAENADKQSRMADDNAATSTPSRANDSKVSPTKRDSRANESNVSKTNDASTDGSKNTANGNNSTGTHSGGDAGQNSQTNNQGSSTAVNPQEPRTTRTVEQGEGKNRSSSGDSAGANEPANDSEGMK